MTKFRIIPASKGYPGLTAIHVSEGREIVSVGVGKDVEAALVECETCNSRISKLCRRPAA